MLEGAAEAEMGVGLLAAGMAKAVPRTALIQAALALGYCQTMTPAFQSLAAAVATQVARVAVSTKPVVIMIDVSENEV